MSPFRWDVTVVGGCGHVGLPLALAFARRGLRVAIYDLNETDVARVNAGCMPFEERGTGEILAEMAGRSLLASSDPGVVSEAEHVVVVVGTPVDEHLDPDPQLVADVVLRLRDYLRSGQLVVLRSTLFPGATARVASQLAEAGLDLEVVCCPERLAEGRAMQELFELPQLIGARTETGAKRAEALFRHLTEETVTLSPEEAELAKLFTNTYRYLKFAIANQLFQIANSHGLDYERIRRAVVHRYPRAGDLPPAGFAAGPCLLKDTMQLAAFNNNDFVLGHASMMVNEGLPAYVVDQMARRWDLARMRVGILGMSFKADTDDIRSSLSYKLRRILRFRAKAVMCSDPFVHGEEIVDLDELLAQCDLLVIGAPHSCYGGLQTSLPVVDIWGLVGGGVQV